MIKNIKHSLDRIFLWMKENSPQTLAHLNPPATDAEIEEVESKIGIPLSQSFKELLRLFNGETSAEWLAFLGDGYQMLSCQGIIEQYKLDQKIGQELYTPEMATRDFWQNRVAEGVIFVKGSVQPLLLHPQWIPFTCMNGDVFRYFDYAPAPGGTIGQVIEVDPEGCSYQVLADSLEAFLAHYAQQLEDGEFSVEEDGYIREKYEIDSMTWGMPEWLKEADS